MNFDQEQIDKIIAERFDLKKREFLSEKGRVLKLRPVNSDLLYAVMRTTQLPEPPMKTITIAGGSTQEIEDYDNEQYQELFTLAFIEQRRKIKTLAFLEGIENEPQEDQDFMNFADIVGITQAKDLKYQYMLWLNPTTLVGDALANVISAQTMPSPEGVEAEIERFPDTGEKSTGHVETDRADASEEPKDEGQEGIADN